MFPDRPCNPPSPQGTNSYGICKKLITLMTTQEFSSLEETFCCVDQPSWARLQNMQILGYVGVKMVKKTILASTTFSPFSN